MKNNKKINLQNNIKFIKHPVKYWNENNIPTAINNFIAIKGIFKKTDLVFLCKYYNIPSWNVIKRRFKSIDVLTTKFNIHFKSKNQRQSKKPNKNIIIYKIKKVYKKYGPFWKKDIDILIGISSRFIRNRFGSLDEMAKQAKITFKLFNISNNDIISKIKEFYNINGPFKKGDIDNFAFISSQALRHRFGSLEAMANEAKITFLSKHGSGRKGQNETKILDNIANEKNIILERQKWFKGGSGKSYYVDAYHKESNTIYEVDEKHHFLFPQKIRDQIRENDIKANTSVNFVRIIEEQYLKNEK